MATCVCMGPQGDAPLCPCRMREVEGYLERFRPRALTAVERSRIVGGPLGGWYDISSAPKNGEHILACDASQSFGWVNGRSLPPVQTVVHWYEFGDESGFYTSINELAPERPFPATHWKPLDGPSVAREPQANTGHTNGNSGNTSTPTPRTDQKP